MDTPGAVHSLFFEILSKMEWQSNLAGAECESANKMEWMMMRSRLCYLTLERRQRLDRNLSSVSNWTGITGKMFGNETANAPTLLWEGAGSAAH